MRKLWVLMIFLVVTAPGGAAGNGPRLMDLTQYVLRLSEQGVWQPEPGWLAWELKKRDKLKTVIYNGRGAVAAVDWEFEVDPERPWARVSKVLGRVPSQGRPLVPGKYFLAIEVNGEMSWGTDFVVRKLNYNDSEHYAVTGPWTDLAYAYSYDQGLVLCYWIEGPKELRWFDSRSYQAKVEFASEVVRRGEVIVRKDKIGTLTIKPGEVASGGVLVAGPEELARLIDGDYELRLLASDETGGPWPVAGLKLPIRGQKIEPNPLFSGPDSNPAYPANAIYYGKNLYSLERVPGYYERR